MALGDIQVLRTDDGSGYDGDVSFNVAAAGTTINAGEPVSHPLGAVAVVPLATGTPVVGTDFMGGISSTTSTQTASLAGTVSCNPMGVETTYICTPTVPGSWTPQSSYDALVGKRVLFTLAGGVYTVAATDGATNGLVVQPLDISKYPGKVAFKVRSAVNYIS